jgi:hypothetical protein
MTTGAKLKAISIGTNDFFMDHLRMTDIIRLLKIPWAALLMLGVTYVTQGKESRKESGLIGFHSDWDIKVPVFDYHTT